jgi:hypothetical protein
MQSVSLVVFKTITYYMLKAHLLQAAPGYIDKELRVIESAHRRYTQVMSTHQFTPGGAQHRIDEVCPILGGQRLHIRILKVPSFKLPGVLAVLRKLRAVRLTVDEYNIHARLDHVWPIVRPISDAISSV